MYRQLVCVEAVDDCLAIYPLLLSSVLKNQCVPSSQVSLQPTKVQQEEMLKGGGSI